MSARGPEIPGFSVPGAPVFNRARATSMFAGTMQDPVAMLDLAMVFGSRLWGHDDVARPEAEAAPGLGDLFTHEWRRLACGAAADAVADALGEPSARWRALVLHTGSEAIETAIKTAVRATRRIRLHAFEDGYHGTFGLALAVTHRAEFREPWAAQYGGTARWTPWGAKPRLDEDVACVVVEPWQGRAGVIPPPPGFHAQVRRACDDVGALLVLDAVLCGAGRSGAEIATCIREAKPDIVCLGKAIGCGAVASVVVCRAELAERAWEHGPVEPAHTSTHVGDPAACAGVLGSLRRLRTRGDELVQASVRWRAALDALVEDLDDALTHRGRGLLHALDTGRPGGGVELATRLLTEHRIIVVPSGTDGSSITVYPSIVTSDGERERFTAAVRALTAHG